LIKSFHYTQGEPEAKPIGWSKLAEDDFLPKFTHNKVLFLFGKYIKPNIPKKFIGNKECQTLLAGK